MNHEEVLVYMKELDRYEASISDLEEDILGADIVCLPQPDGHDTDKDHIPSDDEAATNNPSFLGKGDSCHATRDRTSMV